MVQLFGLWLGRIWNIVRSSLCPDVEAWERMQRFTRIILGVGILARGRGWKDLNCFLWNPRGCGEP